MSRMSAWLGVVLVAASTTLLGTGPAEAAARVTVTNGQSGAVADPTYATTLTLKGRGFQAIKGGYGGIYVLFGTRSGTWQPSKGGKAGTNYLYVPDSQTKDNQGFQKFVAFQGSDTASSANGGTIAADGSWKTTIVVPGATFQTVDSSGAARTVDCRKVTCGIITIGAHGVINARNETFTPVTFKASSSSSSATATTSSSATASATASGTATAV
ncbi:MAG: hypothetical protein QM572_03910, partial [Nocardioides sp.]|uniref:hypothetical protein n=1 Tax=Nocardioides sp. TaxID=35761 RepID=UPI0039E2BEB7